MLVWLGLGATLVFITSSICCEIPGVCTFNPLFLEGTCSARYTDPAAQLIESVFLSLAEADCELANPCHYPPHYSPRDWEEFDFIVVGAGSAGSVVADRLTEVAGWTVLLIEAGGDPPKTSEVPSFTSQLRNSVIDWQYNTDYEEPNCLGFEGNQCKWPRGKVLGGSSTLNGMLYTRGNQKDYDGWETEGNVGWGFTDVLAYFKKSGDMRSPTVHSTHSFYTYHGTGGPLKVEDFNVDNAEQLATLFAKGFAELGYGVNPDYNGSYQLGFVRSQGTLEDGRRCSTAKAYLSPIKPRINLKVSKNSIVTKILIDEIKRIAYGVEFIDINGQTIRVLARKEVIISAGTVNSPQLLMLSGFGPRNHLSELGINNVADFPVGENLQDHTVCIGLILALDYEYTSNAQVKDMLDFLLKNNNKLTNFGVDSYNVFINTLNNGVDQPDIQLYFYSYNKNDSNLVNYLERIVGLRDEIKNQILEISSHSFIVMLQPTLISPYSKGRVRLQSRNPMQYPHIFPGYFNDQRDIDTFIRAIRFLKNFVMTEPLRTSGARFFEVTVESCNTLPFDSQLYRECFLRHLVTSVYHPVGTCRMGPLGHPEAVVDPQLRVQGVDRLRVIDASVMPRIVRGNTNAPTIMIAEKGSDLIKQTWLSTPYSGAGGFSRTLPPQTNSW